MKNLSSSELVYLHADQFIFPRNSPDSSIEIAYATGRRVNKRLMAIEVARAAILANLTLTVMLDN